MHLVSVDGKFYAFCYYITETGERKRKRRSTGIRDDKTAASRRRAEIAGAAIERSLGLGQNRVARQDTIKSAFEALLRRRQLAGDPPAAVEITLQKGAAIVKHFGPDFLASDIDEDALVAYAFARQSIVVSSTIRREFAELRSALKSIGLKLPVTPKLGKVAPRERWLTPDECFKLLAQFSLNRQDYILTYLQTGVRKAELGKLRSDDVFEGPAGWCLRVRGTKTAGSDRVVPLTDTALAVVRRRLGAILFPDWGMLDRDLRKASRRAGLGPVSCNDLRRTFATQLAIAGVPILHLAALMGHKSTRMLESVYARVGRGAHMTAAINLLPNLGRTNARQLESATQPTPDYANSIEDGDFEPNS